MLRKQLSRKSGYNVFFAEWQNLFCRFCCIYGKKRKHKWEFYRFFTDHKKIVAESLDSVI